MADAQVNSQATHSSPTAIVVAPPAADFAREDGETQRERIRRVAVRLFTRNSYAGTSMKALARELGTVPANLYNYYPAKEAILFEVLSHQLTSLISRDQHIEVTFQDPGERLHALTRDLVMADLQDPVAAFVGKQGASGLSDGGRGQISELMAAVRAIWQRAVEDGVKAGIFECPDPRLATLTILSLCASTSTWFDPNGTYTADQVAEHTALVALRSLDYQPPTT